MIVDRDLIKVENFNRSPLFGKSNFGLNKAAAVKKCLMGTRVVAGAAPVSWNAFVENGGRSGYDVWLPLANEDDVRRSMQSNVPPLLIYGATSPNWVATFGRHIPGVDDCLVERFPGPEGVLTCATGKISTPRGTVVDAALPFCSMFAGLLIFAELVRLQMQGYPQVPNYACLDFGGNLTEIQKWNMEPNSNCGCTKLSPSLFRIFNRDSRYFHLAFGSSQ
jgi:hypothetical protein